VSGQRVTFAERVQRAMVEPDETRKGAVVLDFGKAGKPAAEASFSHPLLTPVSVVALSQRSPAAPPLILRAAVGNGRATVYADAPLGTTVKGTVTVNWWVRP
jgi:hypothetical protein